MDFPLSFNPISIGNHDFSQLGLSGWRPAVNAGLDTYQRGNSATSAVSQDHSGFSLSDVASLALLGLSLAPNPALARAGMGLMMGGLVLSQAWEVFKNWDKTNADEKVGYLAHLVTLAGVGFVSGMVGQTLRTQIKVGLFKATRHYTYSKLLASPVLRLLLPRLGEAWGFNAIHSFYYRSRGDERAFDAINIFSSTGLAHTLRTAIWFESSHRGYLWRNQVHRPQTQMKKAQSWVEGTLIGSTLDWGLMHTTTALGWEKQETLPLFSHLSRALPEMALMHLGNKAMAQFVVPGFHRKVGEIEQSTDAALRRIWDKRPLKETYETARDPRYLEQLERIEQIVNEPSRSVVVSDFSGVASVMWATLRRQANVYRKSNEAIAFAFKSRSRNVVDVAEQMALGRQNNLKDVNIQKGQQVGDVIENFSGDQRLFMVPIARDHHNGLVTRVQNKASVVLCNAATAAIDKHYTVDRVKAMATTGEPYVVHMMKGEITYLESGKTARVETPREYMERINKQAGREDIPIVMWVGFDGAKATIKGKSRVHDGQKLVDLLITCSHKNPAIAEKAARREAAAASGLDYHQAKTAYIDRKGVEHVEPAAGRTPVAIYENRNLPRPVKMTAVWHPEVVRAQELMASSKNKWSSVFGQKMHEFQRDQILQKRAWDKTLEAEQIAYEKRIRRDLEAELYQALRDYEAIPSDYAHMFRQNRIDWLECTAFQIGGREKAYQRRQQIMAAETPEQIATAVKRFLDEANTYVTRNPLNGDLMSLGREMVKQAKLDHVSEILPKMISSPEGERSIAASKHRWGDRLPPHLEHHHEMLLANRSPFHMTKVLVKGLVEVNKRLLETGARRQNAGDLLATSERVRQICQEFLHHDSTRRAYYNPITFKQMESFIDRLSIELVRLEGHLKRYSDRPDRLSRAEEAKVSQSIYNFQSMVASISQLVSVTTSSAMREQLRTILKNAKSTHISL